MAAILGPLFSDKKLNFEQYLLNTHWHYTLQIHGITCDWTKRLRYGEKLGYVTTRMHSGDVT